MAQLTTISFYKFTSPADRWWAFGMMGKAGIALGKVNGRTFWKLMGTGGGDAYQWYPDWSTYALLSVWESSEAAHDFFNTHPTALEYASRANESLRFDLQAYRAHGSWGGAQPFELVAPDESGLVCVMTRARIRPKKLIRFWRRVPQVSRSLHFGTAPLFGKGVGTLPLIQQATFSCWPSAEALRDYAYNRKEHAEVVKLTRQLDWYSEELFARFKPIAISGNWSGTEELHSAFSKMTV
jgi:hypothetical protein